MDGEGKRAMDGLERPRKGEPDSLARIITSRALILKNFMIIIFFDTNPTQPV